MKYFLIIFMFWNGPVVTTVGPFNSALACEAAANKSEAMVRQVNRGNARVGTVCVENQIQNLVLPKGIK